MSEGTRSLLVFGLFLATCFGAAYLGSVVTLPAISEWYSTLKKPSWTPPTWLFGPVWTALYLMMAVAGWLVWRQAGWSRALAMFAIQLALNAAWSWLFFGLRRPGIAFAEIALLWSAILGTLVLFWRTSPPATGLLLPYLLWVSYAAVLNLAIWRLNP